MARIEDITKLHTIANYAKDNDLTPQYIYALFNRSKNGVVTLPKKKKRIKKVNIDSVIFVKELKNK